MRPFTCWQRNEIIMILHMPPPNGNDGAYRHRSSTYMDAFDDLEHEQGPTPSVAPTPPVHSFPSSPEPSSCLQHLVAYPRLTLTYQNATSDNNHFSRPPFPLPPPLCPYFLPPASPLPTIPTHCICMVVVNTLAGKRCWSVRLYARNCIHIATMQIRPAQKDTDAPNAW